MKSTVGLSPRALALGSVLLLLGLISACCPVGHAQQTSDKLDDVQKQKAIELLENLLKEGVDPIKLLQEQLDELKKNKENKGEDKAKVSASFRDDGLDEYMFDSDADNDDLEEHSMRGYSEMAQVESSSPNSATSQAPIALNADTATADAPALVQASVAKPAAPQIAAHHNEHVEADDTSKHSQETPNLSVRSSVVEYTPSLVPESPLSEQHIGIQTAAFDKSQQPEVVSGSENLISPDATQKLSLKDSSYDLSTPTPPKSTADFGSPAPSSDAPKTAPPPEEHNSEPEKADTKSTHSPRHEAPSVDDWHMHDDDDSRTEFSHEQTPTRYHAINEPLLLSPAIPSSITAFDHLESPTAQQTEHKHYSENHEHDVLYDEIGQHQQHAHQTGQPEDEQHEETYIDHSDPHDPKQVHIKKVIKKVQGPHGESQQYHESRTSTSLGNNHDTHHSSSSSFSSSLSSSSSSNPTSPIGYKQKKKQKRHQSKKHYQQPLQMPGFHRNVGTQGNKANKRLQIPPIPLVPLPLMPYRMPSWPHFYMDPNSAVAVAAAGPYGYQLPYGSAGSMGMPNKFVRKNAPKRVKKNRNANKRAAHQAAKAGAMVR